MVSHYLDKEIENRGNAPTGYRTSHRIAETVQRQSLKTWSTMPLVKTAL